MALCDKILITGPSGAGKSSLVRALKSSAPEDWDHFDDLDALILKKRGKGLLSLADLIENHGWDNFRLWERQELESWLKNEGKGVLALGGGALSPLVWELFGSQIKIKYCYLKVPFEISWDRLALPSSEKRPLVKLGQNKLRELFESRREVFDQIPWQLDGRLPLNELSKLFWQSV